MDAKRISIGRKTTAAAKRPDDREEIHNAAPYRGLEQSDTPANKNQMKRIPVVSP
jgi:hypothetical protein